MAPQPHLQAGFRLAQRTYLKLGGKIMGKLALRSFDDESGLIHPEALQELSDAEEAHFRDHLVQTRFVVQRHRDFASPLRHSASTSRARRWLIMRSAVNRILMLL